MTPFEYLLLFESIILGLAVGDLAKSLHRLLHARTRVRWDWLAPLTATMILLKIVNHWWSWFGLAPLIGRLTFEMFLAMLAATLLLYLISAETLPDDTPDGAIDLRAHYAAVSARLWSLFIAHSLLVLGIALWARATLPGTPLAAVLVAALGPAVGLSMMIVRSRGWHGACVTCLGLLYLAQFVGQTLTP